MTFEVVPDAEHPELLNDGLKYDGMRFRVEGTLAGKIYGERFGTDVVLGEPIFGEPDPVTADHLLAFAGLPPPTMRVYPLEMHIAEKLHAYTLPRTRPRGRTLASRICPIWRSIRVLPKAKRSGRDRFRRAAGLSSGQSEIVAGWPFRTDEAKSRSCSPPRDIRTRLPAPNDRHLQF